MSPRLAVERLMLLDALLAIPEVDWLTTASERAACLDRLRGDASADGRRTVAAEEVSTVSSRVRVTPPIGVAPDGRTVLVYLASEPSTDRLRAFLQAHRELLRVTPSWTLRLVFPRPLHHVYATYLTVIRQEVAALADAAPIREPQRHLAHSTEDAAERVPARREGFPNGGSTVTVTSRSAAVDEQGAECGNLTSIGSSSSALAEAHSIGRGRVEAVELRPSYRHLFPLVAETPARPQPMDTGLRGGPASGPTSSRVLNLRPQPHCESRTPTLQEQMDLEWRRLAQFRTPRKRLDLQRDAR